MALLWCAASRDRANLNGVSLNARYVLDDSRWISAAWFYIASAIVESVVCFVFVFCVCVLCLCFVFVFCVCVLCLYLCIVYNMCLLFWYRCVGIFVY